VILFDTSLLIDALASPRRSLPDLLHVMDHGERLVLCSIVAYEWSRGPRNVQELETQEKSFPCESAIPFEAADAQLAAKLYRSVRRARSREVDIAIAACAISHECQVWTLNSSDFEDIPGLRLFDPKV
jgi:predicted nucleic acid-binding protein